MEVSEEGQITLPKYLRDELDLTPGTEVECELVDDTIVISKVRNLSRTERMGRRRTQMSDDEVAALLD